MNKNQKILIGTIGAMLTGIAIGLLIAPDKGKATRKLLKGKASDLGGTAKNKYEKGVVELTGLVDKLKENLSKNVEAAKDKVASIKDNVKSTVNNTNS